MCVWRHRVDSDCLECGGGCVDVYMCVFVYVGVCVDVYVGVGADVMGMWHDRIDTECL